MRSTGELVSPWKMNINLEGVASKESNTTGVNLSPFETVVAFDPVRPLARVPVPAGQGDDPSKGPYVLAFRNEELWRRAWRTCKEKIETQCQAGAKLGCSISAANACHGRPWWKLALPFMPHSDEDPSRREECEAREMRGCIVAAQERCSTFARETCDPAYADMRIAAPGAPIDRRFSGEPLQRPRVTRRHKLQSPNSKQSPQSEDLLHKPDATTDEERLQSDLGVTTFRGRLLMHQHEPREEWEKKLQTLIIPEALATQNSTGVQESFPKEGWVGGLVHPAVAARRSSTTTEAPEKEKEGGQSIAKGPICIALDLWQKLHQSVMERFT